MLVSAPRRGTFVRSFTKKDIDDIFTFRLLIENFGLEQGLARMTDADLAGITAHAEAMDLGAVAGDVEALVKHDLAFHQSICNLSDNHQTQHAFQNIEAELQMLIIMAEKRFDTMEQAAADHWPVVEAIASRDLVRASAALHDHIMDSWRRLAEAFDRPDGTLTHNLKQY